MIKTLIFMSLHSMISQLFKVVTKYVFLNIFGMKYSTLGDVGGVM